MRVFLILFILVNLGCAQEVYLNNSGVIKIKLQDTEGGRKQFLKALSFDSEFMTARYNLAISDLATERINEAFKEIQYLEEELKRLKFSSEGEKKKYLFKLSFAKAFLNGVVEKTPEALEAYQDCLELDPKSEAVKKNIELLLTSQKGKSGKKGNKKNKSKDKGEGEGDGQKKEKGKKSQEPDQGEKEKYKKQKGESLKKKNFTKEEIEQILNEIKKQESKVRAKEGKKYKGKSSGEKSW